jgi:hypothetical protein
MKALRGTGSDEEQLPLLKAGFAPASKPGSRRTPSSRPVSKSAERIGSRAWFERHQLTLPLEVRLPDAEVVWTLEEENALRLNLLEVSHQHLLDGRSGMQTRKEILLWFAMPLVRDPAEMEPFSFQACCLAAGQYPDLVQDALVADLEQRAGRDRSLRRLMEWYRTVETRLTQFAHN